MAAPDHTSARCWQCGYPLRDLPADRCPECGRPFDPAAPATMNFGRPMGRLARAALAPLGRSPLLISVLAAGLVWSTVRAPVPGWRFALIDLLFYARAWDWRTRRPPANSVDACYSAGLLIAALATAGWALRLLARTTVIAIYRVPAFQRGRFWRRSFAQGLFVLAAFAGVGAGWPWRVGQRLAREWEFATRTPGVSPAAGPLGDFGPGVNATEPDAACAYRAALTFGDSRQRLAAVKWVAERVDGGARATALAAIRAAARDERDPDVRALELRLLGLDGDEAAAHAMLADLGHADARIRAAAADALGLIAAADDPVDSPARLATDPPITFNRDHWPHGRVPSTQGPPPLSDAAWHALDRLMLADADPAVRDAAAYALAHAAPAVPGADRLRVAEWGVWIAAGPLSLPMTREQIASIPPFVHTTGDVADELARQIEQPTNILVTKPVIHLTVDAPLAVDLQVMVHQGRPWFAYPAPDELTLELGEFWAGTKDARVRRPRLTVAALDPPGLPPLANARREFPWLLPARRTYPFQGFYHLSGAQMSNWSAPASYPMVGQISGVGVRWHSLIVTPAKPAWLAPPAVPPDPKYAWWPRLRDVESSWVTSRNEGDRFLYYDGPTLAATPVTPRLAGDRLEWTVADHFVAWNEAKVIRPAARSHRDALYVDVAPDKAVRGGAFADPTLDVDGEGGRPIADVLAPMSVQDLERTLAALCRVRGLTDSETAGLIACWRMPFFERPGRRFLLLLSPADYDAALPLTARPTPREMARVGIVLTEFGVPR
jgi:hypothetical protein